MDEVEKLANELYKEYWKDSIDDFTTFDDIEMIFFRRIARFVMRREIEDLVEVQED